MEDQVEDAPVLALCTDAEERFALELVKTGGNATQAYLRLHPGASYNTAKVSASRLLDRPQVVARVEELRAELREQAKADLTDAVMRLRGWAGGDIRDVAEYDHLGLKVKPSDELTPEAAALIQEVEMTPTQYGRKIRVKLVDRLAAQKELNSILGLRKVVVEGEVVHRVFALPARQPSVQEWMESYRPEHTRLLPGAAPGETDESP